MRYTFNTFLFVSAVFYLCLLNSCRTVQVEPSMMPPGTRALLNPCSDPLENFNRSMQATNKVLVNDLFYPVGESYTYIVPRCIRQCITNFGQNAGYPGRLLNNALQGKFANCWDETMRFGINTTLGLLGLFDIASIPKIPAHPEDFGQTFEHYGCGEGPFLNLPVLGPYTTRDLAGKICDLPFNLVSWVFTGGDTAQVINGVVTANDMAENMRFFDSFFDDWEDSYLITKTYTTAQRRVLCQDYHYHQVRREDPEESLGLLMAVPHDSDYIRRARTHLVRIPGTKSTMPYTLWPVKKPRAFTIILPGIGASRNTDNVVCLVETLNKHGNLVVSLDSTLSKEFIENTPSQIPPGYIPEDAKLLAGIISSLIADCRKNCPDLADCPVNLLGYSLGGIHTLFLADLQKRQGLIPEISQFLAINPPPDAQLALQTIDDFMAIPEGWPENEREEHLPAIIRELLKMTSPDSYLPLDLTYDESRFLIGLNIRLKLATAIIVSQRRHNLGVLKNDPAKLFGSDALFAEALSTSYDDYITNYILPECRRLTGRPELTVEQLAEECRLSSIADSLRGNDKIHVFHNANDCLVPDGGIDWFADTFGDRLVIHPHGSHLGNLGFPAYQEAICDILCPAN